METVKNKWLWGIFISLLCIFAMSHNANAIQFDLNDYSIKEQVASLKINSKFYDWNSGNLLYDCVDQWSCAYNGRVYVNNLYTTTTYNFEKGDIAQFNVQVYTDALAPDAWFYQFMIGQGTSEFIVIDIEKLVENQFVSDGDYNFYNLYKFTILFTSKQTNIPLGWRYQQRIMRFESSTLIRFALNNFIHYTYEGSQENKEVEEKTQEAVDESEAAGGNSSQSAQSGTTGLLNAITGAVNVISSATPTNCKINGNMGNLDMGQLDLCANPAPAFIQTIGSLILILICVPLAISLFNRFISIFRSFQS